MIISYTGLALTIMPSVLVLAGSMTMDLNKLLMLTGTVLWFGTVSFWMNKSRAS